MLPICILEFGKGDALYYNVELLSDEFRNIIFRICYLKKASSIQPEERHRARHRRTHPRRRVYSAAVMSTSKMRPMFTILLCALLVWLFAHMPLTSIKVVRKVFLFFNFARFPDFCKGFAWLTHTLIFDEWYAKMKVYIRFCNLRKLNEVDDFFVKYWCVLPKACVNYFQIARCSADVVVSHWIDLRKLPAKHES